MGRSMAKIHRELQKTDSTVRYSTIQDFVHRHTKDKESINNQAKSIEATVTRNEVKKYILKWKCPKEKVDLIEKYPTFKDFEIKELHMFYKNFHSILINRAYSSMKKILNHCYRNKFIQKFIDSLKHDYKAIVNSSKYRYNNSQVEGQVGKLKQIKHDMYGRSGVHLLKNKVIYQSLFF